MFLHRNCLLEIWLEENKNLLSSAKKRKSNTCTPIEKIDVFGSESEDQDYSDEERMSSSKRKKSFSHRLLSIETQISQVLETVGESKQEMMKILQFSNENDVPLALKNLVKETFSCKICHKAPFAPPIVASTCCGAIIGCQSCIQSWYGTGSDVFDKACPLCRAERGYSHTFRLCGMDDFLIKLNKMQDKSHE